MYAAGCFSDKEHWFRPDTQGAHLTGVTGESCCTYNMLKLARRLFALNPRIETADYIERAIYNHILAQQEPMEGRITYFMPMMTGSYKLRNRANDAFWCCVGSAMESQTGFADYIAQESGNALYVNLFIPSRIMWRGFTFELSETTLKCVSAAANASSPVLYVREPRRRSNACLQPRTPLRPSSTSVSRARVIERSSVPGSRATKSALARNGRSAWKRFRMIRHMRRSSTVPGFSAVALARRG